MCQALSILSLQFGVQCKYVEFSLLMQAMKERISEKTSDGDIKSPLRTVPVLAVDELGKVRGTEWELSELDALVAFRYQTGKTTLFASNFDERELEKRVGGRIFSRLKERCRFMNVSGDDFRRRIK
jgi:DNA replication protein DnaC